MFPSEDDWNISHNVDFLLFQRKIVLSGQGLEKPVTHFRKIANTTIFQRDDSALPCFFQSLFSSNKEKCKPIIQGVCLRQLMPPKIVESSGGKIP